MTTVPTSGETFTKLLHHIREAQDCAAMLAHLANASGSSKDRVVAQGWLVVSEQLKRFVYVVTEMAKGKLQ